MSTSKIALFSDSLQRGGAQRVMVTLASALSEEGFDVDLVLIKEEGFYNVVTPSYNTRSEYLSQIFFDEDNEVFTYNVLDRAWDGTIDELKEDQIGDVKSRAHQYLSKTDWYISRKAEHDIAIPDNIIAERKDIKDKVIQAETDINALSAIKEIFEYTIQLIENEGV